MNSIYPYTIQPVLPIRQVRIGSNGLMYRKGATGVFGKAIGYPLLISTFSFTWLIEKIANLFRRKT